MFRLCEHLKGFAHPDYLLPWLSAEQLLDWVAYARHVGRFGVDRDDVLFAMLAKVWTGGELESYMPYRDPYAEDLTAEELAERLGLPPPAGGEDD